MTDLLEIRPVSRERHSQLADGLYQVLLCVVTFECAVAIARYDPSPPTGAITWSTGGTNGSNSTTERMCRFGAREDDVDVGSLAVCLPTDTCSALSILRILTGGPGRPTVLHPLSFNHSIHRVMHHLRLGNH